MGTLSLILVLHVHRKTLVQKHFPSCSSSPLSSSSSRDLHAQHKYTCMHISDIVVNAKSPYLIFYLDCQTFPCYLLIFTLCHYELTGNRRMSRTHLFMGMSSVVHSLGLYLSVSWKYNGKTDKVWRLIAVMHVYRDAILFLFWWKSST